MGEFDNIFSQISQAKPTNSRADKLPVGQHSLVLKTYGPKRSQKDSTIRLEADFLISASNTLKPGDTRNHAWFIQAAGFGAAADQGRAKEFIEAVMRSVDLATLPPAAPVTSQNQVRPKNADGSVIHDAESVGGLLAAGYFRGMQLSVEIQLQMANGAPKLSKAGNQVFNVFWKPVPGQTNASIAETRAALDAEEGLTQRAPVAAPVPYAAAPAPAPALPAATPGALGGILANLRRPGA